MSDPFRTIIGIENRTAQEVFDILCDRFKSHDASQKAEIERLRAALQEARDMVWPMDISTDRVSATLRILDTALSETSNGKD